MTPRLSDALLERHLVLAVDRRSQELATALQRHGATVTRAPALKNIPHIDRSEEHTSELQSRGHLVCRLLLEKKNISIITRITESSTIQLTYVLDSRYYPHDI